MGLNLLVQHFLMDTVGGAEALATALIASADILYTTVAVPVPDHGDKDVSALRTAEQTSIAMLGLVTLGGASLCLQPLLSGVPQLFADDWRENIFMPKSL